MKLRALSNGIIFQFEEHTSNAKHSKFKEQTDWGFQLGANFDSSAKKSRWGIVVEVGPEVIDDGIKSGARIFIEALKWTNGFELDGQKYWKTDESHVLAVDENY